TPVRRSSSPPNAENGHESEQRKATDGDARHHELRDPPARTFLVRALVVLVRSWSFRCLAGSGSIEDVEGDTVGLQGEAETPLSGSWTKPPPSRRCDYVPTQVFTEYVRHVLGDRDDPVRGIRYGSAVRPDGVSWVLFIGPEGCTEARSGWEDNQRHWLGLQTAEKDWRTLWNDRKLTVTASPN
ncbi:MAG TPA: RES domain-containing protein, partial [Acidimicrobiales bacterium]|nr:RES domain-containing protein [Acidimicrobiales bacterium]